MESSQEAFVVAYLLTSLYFCKNWLRFFKRNANLSVEDRFLSVVILVIATISWPVVVPISYLELLRNRKLQLNGMMPVVLAVFMVSLITLSGLAAFGKAVL